MLVVLSEGSESTESERCERLCDGDIRKDETSVIRGEFTDDGQLGSTLVVAGASVALLCSQIEGDVGFGRMLLDGEVLLVDGDVARLERDLTMEDSSGRSCVTTAGGPRCLLAVNTR